MTIRLLTIAATGLVLGTAGCAALPNRSSKAAAASSSDPVPKTELSYELFSDIIHAESNAASLIAATLRTPASDYVAALEHEGAVDDDSAAWTDTNGASTLGDILAAGGVSSAEFTKDDYTKAIALLQGLEATPPTTLSEGVDEATARQQLALVIKLAVYSVHLAPSAAPTLALDGPAVPAKTVAFNQYTEFFGHYKPEEVVFQGVDPKGAIHTLGQSHTNDGNIGPNARIYNHSTTALEITKWYIPDLLNNLQRSYELRFKIAASTAEALRSAGNPDWQQPLDDFKVEAKGVAGSAQEIKAIKLEIDTAIASRDASQALEIAHDLTQRARIEARNAAQLAATQHQRFAIDLSSAKASLGSRLKAMLASCFGKGKAKATDTLDAGVDSRDAASPYSNASEDPSTRDGHGSEAKGKK